VQDLETQIIMQSPTLRASDPITVEVPRRRDEWKVVPRPANPRRVAFTQAIVDER